MRERSGAADGGLDRGFAGGETEIEFGGSPTAGILDENGEVVRLREAVFVGVAAAQRAEGEGGEALFPNRLPGGVAAGTLAGIPIQDHALDQITFLHRC